MNWQEICSNPNLQNLPFKIESNRQGQLIMSPAKLSHGAYQVEIAHILKKSRTHGKVVTECAVKTSEGTKVADVTWFSEERWRQVKEAFESPVSPEICVEIISDSNTRKELSAKKKLYFENGAEEFWLCGTDGTIAFYSRNKGKTPKSLLIPEFPIKIEI
jgi:Uma2 family endonuclease